MPLRWSSGCPSLRLRVGAVPRLLPTSADSKGSSWAARSRRGSGAASRPHAAPAGLPGLLGSDGDERGEKGAKRLRPKQDSASNSASTNKKRNSSRCPAEGGCAATQAPPRRPPKARFPRRTCAAFMVRNSLRALVALSCEKRWFPRRLHSESRWRPWPSECYDFEHGM